jgi:hypothetical protein
MDSSKIKALFFGVIAAFAGLYMGISAATAQIEAVAWTVGGITLFVCFLLGRKIWLLIPFLGTSITSYACGDKWAAHGGARPTDFRFSLPLLPQITDHSALLPHHK